MATELKMERAKQLLVRYIRDQRLRPGDKLPSQFHFREKLKFGTTTIAAALKELQTDGVVEVRDKVGVFLIDADADGHISRTVAVTETRLEDSLFYCVLTAFLQQQLARHGCLMRLFTCQAPDVTGEFSVNQFAGLRRCIEDGSVQGVLNIDDFDDDSVTFFREREIPLLKVGGVCRLDKGGLFFDYSDLVKRAVEQLRAFGCRKPAFLFSRALLRYVTRDCAEVLRDHWGRDGGEGMMYLGGTRYEESAAEFTQRYLALPPARRADGFIILDDILGSLFSVELARHLPPEQLPAASVLRNVQLHLPFSFPRRSYLDIDVLDLAGQAVGLIAKAMKNGTTTLGENYYHPAGGDEARAPAPEAEEVLA